MHTLRKWQLQDAKNRFSEVVDQSLVAGPQVITRRGVETAVLISFEEYSSMATKPQSLIEFFRSSPLVGVELDLERDKSPLRPPIEL